MSYFLEFESDDESESDEWWLKFTKMAGYPQRIAVDVAGVPILSCEQAAELAAWLADKEKVEGKA